MHPSRPVSSAASALRPWSPAPGQCSPLSPGRCPPLFSYFECLVEFVGTQVCGDWAWECGDIENGQAEPIQGDQSEIDIKENQCTVARVRKRGWEPLAKTDPQSHSQGNWRGRGLFQDLHRNLTSGKELWMSPKPYTPHKHS